MKKFLICFILLMFGSSAYSTVVEGGVKFDVNSARDYVAQGQPYEVEITQPAVFIKNDTVERVVYSYNNYNNIIGITVLYKTELNKTYIYNSQSRLIYVEMYDKPVTIYPHRGYRYDTNGKLILTSLTVSKNELFRFSPDGVLIAHSINGIVYDENGNVIGHGK